MTEKTKITKDFYLGWMGTTQIEIGEAEEGKTRILEFTTCKRYGGLVHTRAQVFVFCSATNSKSFIVFQDFNANVENHGKMRATEKTIKAAHEKSAQLFEAVTEKAKAQYAAA